MTSKIIGTGNFVPEKRIDNDYLSTIVDTSDRWIVERTGIKERRVAQEETTVLIAAKAGEKALENGKINPEEVDLIILATMSGDNVLPNGACQVQELIGAKNAVCFDINAACTGFIYALSTAQAYIKSGMFKTVLIIGAEVLSRMIDWNDRGTCILFGDGAGAAVIKASETGFVDQVLKSSGEKAEVLTCKNRRNNNLFAKEEEKTDYIYMNGQEVFRFAVKRVPECINQLLEKTGVKAEEIDYFILHQANIRIIKSVANRMGVGLDKFPSNLDKYGNTSAASIPILLDELNRENKLKRGDKIILTGFGGGLTWGAVLLEW